MALHRLLLTTTVALVCTAGVAKADAILSLSTHSSNATSPSVLSAKFTFILSGSTLTLTVDNNTGGGDAYEMDEIYFNGPSGLAMTLAGGTGWVLTTGGNANKADGFGTFDFAVKDASNPTTNTIKSGLSLSFVFTITSGSAVEQDFVTFFSATPPPDRLAIIAAKFVRGPKGGPGGSSAHGAFIPLPAALPMGIAGLIGVAFIRRRTTQAK